MGKGRNRNRRKMKKLKKKGLLPERKERKAVEPRERPDPSTRFSNLESRGTKFGFKGTGTRVPVDMDADDPAEQLAANTLAAHLGEDTAGEA